MTLILYFDGMNRLWLLLGVSIYFISPLSAQLESPSASGGRAIGLGHAYTAVGADYWALHHNPAGIADIPAAQAGVYIEQRFLLSALNFAQAGFVAPFAENQAIGISMSSFGFKAYQENSIGLSYGIKVLNKIRIGAALNYANLRYKNKAVMLVSLYK